MPLLTTPSTASYKVEDIFPIRISLKFNFLQDTTTLEKTQRTSILQNEYYNNEAFDNDNDDDDNISDECGDS